MRQECLIIKLEGGMLQIQEDEYGAEKDVMESELKQELGQEEKIFDAASAYLVHHKM